MECESAHSNQKASRQVPKLKSLLKKYRHVRTIQSSLLQLSELANNVTDIDCFYSSLDNVISKLLHSDSFYIVLTDKYQNLSLAYSHNPIERNILKNLNHNNWLNTLTGTVFINEQPLQCNANQRNTLIARKQLTDSGTEFIDWLGVPLIRNHHTIGVLALQSYRKNHYFSEEDCELLDQIAEHIVTAIDRVQSRELLESSIQQRTEKLTQANKRLQQEISERQKIERMQSAMLAISELTSKVTQVETFYQHIHQKIKETITADNLYIACLKPDTNSLYFPYYVDENFNNPGERKFGNGLTEQVITYKKTLLISDGVLSILNDDGSINSKPFPDKHNRLIKNQCWLASPLFIQGKVVGVLTIQHYQNKDMYQTSDMSLMRFISQHVSTALERQQEQLNRLNYQSELERQVNERTQALQASNLKLRMQIDERRKVEQQLYHDAHHDVLTQLPNRAMLSERLTQALRHLKRYPSHQFSVLFIDLDRFKIINDTLGHRAGDEFLIEVANRITKCVRDNDVLSRLGGDEFVILLDVMTKAEDVEEIASRIIHQIELPFEFEGNELHSSASIGIACCNSSYQDSSEILRDADAAMYQAKSLGRGRYMFFDVSMREQLMASLTLEQELRVAIKEKQFELHYQQISNLTNEQIIGYEALLRWQHPVKGLLTPSEFLFMAEETGMILEIETWVIEQACQQIKHWSRSSEAEHHNAFISINLSGRQLTQPNQLLALISLLKKQPIELEKLIFEFDEAAFSQRAELALQGLNKLKDLGVKLALDDYGSGMSSFNFIHSYPFEFIKLDRSFIRAINSNDKNLTLIHALQALGEKFGYRLVAEGIESKEILQKVHQAGCEFGQGYYLNKPEILSNKTVKNIASCA